MSWEVLRRFAGEKLTVAEILGRGVQGAVEVEGSSCLDFGAKKWEITCCFGFPIIPMSPAAIVAAVVMVPSSDR